MSLAKLLTGFDDSALEELEQRHRLLPEVKAAYQRMQQAAAGDGIELALVSSYRSLPSRPGFGQQNTQASALSTTKRNSKSISVR